MHALQEASLLEDLAVQFSSTYDFTGLVDLLDALVCVWGGVRSNMVWC